MSVVDKLIWCVGAGVLTAASLAILIGGCFAVAIWVLNRGLRR